MDITNYFKFLSPLQDQLSGFYSTATLVITFIAILWLINFIFGLIYRIYSLGKSIGFIYRNYFHKYVRYILYSVLYLFPGKRRIK